MSKTNHSRGFVATRDGERYSGSPLGGAGAAAPLTGNSVGASFGGDNSNGHRGYAEAKRGAKKFVRTRVRFRENQTTRALAKEAAAAVGPASPVPEPDTFDESLSA